MSTVLLNGSPQTFDVLSLKIKLFTHFGTNTYIVGEGAVAVIDPGPMIEEHVDKIEGALNGETVTHIIVTHTHIDHSPAATWLKELVGAP